MKKATFHASVFWLWGPVLFLLFVLAFEDLAPPDLKGSLVAENGLAEALQFLLMAAGFVAAVIALRKIDVKKYFGIALLLFLGALCCLYVAGEEISWGQHIFYWETPDHWTHINDQNETNLHNTSSWLDQKPRLLLELGVLVGGLLLPLLIIKTPRLIPKWLRAITPPPHLSVIAALFVFVKLSDKLAELTHFKAFIRPSEICEFYVYYFVLAYILYLKAKFCTANSYELSSTAISSGIPSEAKVSTQLKTSKMNER